MGETQDSLYMVDSQNSLGSLGLIDEIQAEDILPSADTDMAEFHQLSPNTINEIERMISSHDDSRFVLQCDSEQKFSRLLPHLGQLPSTEQIETKWDFDCELNSESAGKTSWMFSNKLNKVFVKINTQLNVYAKFKIVDPNQILFIRAMIVYQQTNDFAEPVRKCPNHRDQSTMDFPEHILRCSIPYTEYCGKETGKLFGDKLSLRIPMANVANGEPLKLQFTCQNSCSGGMNRRHTSVIFTLENQTYEILGRKTLNFKVCSCPKRDKEKDEEVLGKTLPKKRKLDEATTSKKIAVPVPLIKQESELLHLDTKNISLPSEIQSTVFTGKVEMKKEVNPCNVSIALPNIDLKKQVLKFAYDTIAGEMFRTGIPYQSYLKDIQKQIDES